MTIVAEEEHSQNAQVQAEDEACCNCLSVSSTKITLNTFNLDAVWHL